jgi:hypothetical protein
VLNLRRVAQRLVARNPLAAMLSVMYEVDWTGMAVAIRMVEPVTNSPERLQRLSEQAKVFEKLRAALASNRKDGPQLPADPSATPRTLPDTEQEDD